MDEAFGLRLAEGGSALGDGDALRSSQEEEFTMAKPDEAASIQACAMRLARLAADGTTPAGATNGYCTKNFVTLSATPEINEGQDFEAPNACGELIITARDRPITKRWNLSMEWLMPDPEAAEMLVSAPLILSTAAAVISPTGSITSASDVITTLSIGVTGLHVGAAVTGTGVGVGAVVAEILSPTSVRVSVVSTATNAAAALTITPVAQGIGNQAPALGVQASDNGVSLELWSKAVVGSGPAAVLPYYRWAFVRTYWRFADREFANSRQAQKFEGYGIENINWGNGPFNDWVDASPSAKTLSRAWGYHRAATLPAVGSTYITVPAQV